MKLAAFFITSILLSVAGYSQSNSIVLNDFQEQIRLNTKFLKDSIPVTATSDCGKQVHVEFTDKKFSGGCAGVLERTYTITDDCNNRREAVQYITLVDDTPPFFATTPEDEILSSRSEYRKAPTMVAFDESGNDVTVDLDETTDFSNEDYVVVTRIWTATDACDNTATYESTVKIPRANPEAENQ